MITYAELFAGVGGWSALLPATHYRQVFAIENHQRTAGWYLRNNPHNLMICEDIRKVSPKGLSAKNVDIIFASPPCQAYSLARTKLTEHKDLDLSSEIPKFVIHYEPRFVIVENVASYLKFPAAIKLMQRLVALGYNVIHDSLSMWDYGVPQDRIRGIIIASRNDQPYPTFPESLPIASRVGWLGACTAISEHYEPSNWMQAISRHVPTTDNQLLFTHLASTYHTEAHKLAGKWRFTLPLDREEYTAFLLPTGNTTREITWRADFHPAVTVTARSGGHHFRVVDRRYPDLMQLTMRCIAALQTFPPEYRWPAVRQFCGHLIGNAVPPLFSKVLTEHLLRNTYEQPAVATLNPPSTGAVLAPHE